ARARVGGTLKPPLLPFVGTRACRIAHMCKPLDAAVAIATSDDIPAARADTLDESVRVSHVIRAPHRDDLLRHCLDHTGRVDGALSFSDEMLDVTARYAAARGLPGQPVTTIDAFRDKYEQRRKLAAAGLPVPPYAEITSPAEAAD